MIALAFGWVAVYSHLLSPGHELAHYEAYAQRSSPIVAIVAGVPVFFAAGALCGRRGGARGAKLALRAAILYALLDVVLVALFTQDPAFHWTVCAIGGATKLLSVVGGGRVGAARAAARS